ALRCLDGAGARGDASVDRAGDLGGGAVTAPMASGTCPDLGRTSFLRPLPVARPGRLLLRLHAWAVAAGRRTGRPALLRADGLVLALHRGALPSRAAGCRAGPGTRRHPSARAPRFMTVSSGADPGTA